MLHRNTVSPTLFDTAVKLTSIRELSSFRMVGGTALALQIGHRQSIDIDLFSNAKVNKRPIVDVLNQSFPGGELYLTQHSIQVTISGVKVELYDDWDTPFIEKPVQEEGLRLAALKDLAALKLDTIIARREKKDYIDLHFLFKHLGAQKVLHDFRLYNPHLSDRSILFALGEVDVAGENKSVMPEMLIDISWPEIERSMIDAAKLYVSMKEQERKSEQ